MIRLHALCDSCRSAVQPAAFDADHETAGDLKRAFIEQMGWRIEGPTGTGALVTTCPDCVAGRPRAAAAPQPLSLDLIAEAIQLQARYGRGCIPDRPYTLTLGELWLTADGRWLPGPGDAPDEAAQRRFFFERPEDVLAVAERVLGRLPACAAGWEGMAQRVAAAQAAAAGSHAP